MKASLLLLLALALLLTVPMALAESRTWTSADGRTLTAELLAVEGDQVTLKTERGNFQLPLSRLSEPDQAYAKEWKAKSVAPPTSAPAPGSPAGGGDTDKSLGDFANLKPGVWPNAVSADFEVDQIEVVKEDKDAGEYVYRSPHFEFHSPLKLSTTVVREFSRIFEATFEFMKAMPIGLSPKPKEGGHYFTQLYDSMDAYYGAGGVPGSGGMFSYSWRGSEVLKSEIHVPLTSLGVEFTGTRYIVDHGKRSDTLVHEIAHQMTGRWLPVLPVWFKEGLAETVSTQRYDSGRFTLTSMDRAIREDVTERTGNDREFTMLNLETLMNLTSEEWAAALQERTGGAVNYPSANLLFYYFLRIEGDGKGSSMIEYMKAIAAGTPEAQARGEILMRGKTYAEIQDEVAKGWRSQGLQLTFR
ncbi:MAG: hypothetical protein JNK37_05330 [Verrucomicrobiales bacterium]|nr:hypothetical protein [Verrucomicrobiales bacterium]